MYWTALADLLFLLACLVCQLLAGKTHWQWPARGCLFCRLRWTVRGIPRVPWETEGIFDGISEYKLDKQGKIYEHKITNVQMRDPPLARSPLSIGLNMIPVPRLQGQVWAPSFS